MTDIDQQSHRADGVAPGVVALADDRLYALMNRLDLDGSAISSHPVDARGVTSINCYLLVQGNEALLLDTGLAIHEDLIVAHLEPLLEGIDKLTLWCLRFGEFNSIANFRSLVDRFEVAEAYGLYPEVADWVDVRSDRTPFGTPLRSGRMADVVGRGLSGVHEITLGGARRLEVIGAELQTLPSHWVFDEATLTLFSNEMFGWVWREDPSESWRADDSSSAQLDSAIQYLADSGKYWWLRGARAELLRHWLSTMRSERRIERIAPAFGCVIEGADVVEHHFRLLDEALETLECESADGPWLVPSETSASRLKPSHAACSAGSGAGARPRPAPDAAAPLPRELAPGVFWFGSCVGVPYGERTLHTINSQYLVTGDNCSLLVETGGPTDLPVVEAMLERLLESGAPPLRYIFPTHPETPHAGGLSRLLERFPDAVACGDPTDLLLVFPWIEDRLWELPLGGSLDLGGSEFTVVPAILRDHASSRWGFDSRSRMLFAGDGLSYAHFHEAGQCGHTAEEVPQLDIAGMTALFSEAAFYWTRFVDMDAYIERFEELLEELAVARIAPTHGLPILDPGASLPQVYEGLRSGAVAERSNVFG